MKKKQSPKVWGYKPETLKFTANDKAKILTAVKAIIEELPKLSQKVTRVDMRTNRVYFYELIEQFKTEGAIYIKPLIEDKYLEFPYARITLNDAQGSNCTTDWQRHNNQWISLYTGTLKECINSVENDDGWY
jgi:hypothetical protein